MAEDRTCDHFSKGIFLITVLGFALRSYGLPSQPLSGDDTAVGISAINFIERGHLGPTMWNHPGLRNILVYLSMLIFGSGVWGLKIVSLTVGTLSVPFVGLIAKRLFNHAGIALLAAFFLAIDPLHIDFSRQAVHEVYMAFFSLAGIYFALRYLDGQKPYLLILSGISFGLGMASKWNVIFSLITAYSVLLYKILRDSGFNRPEKSIKLLFVTSAIVVLPVTIYILTFIPWFQRGYSIPEWIFLQKAMLLESKTHTGYLSSSIEFDHKPYLWFVKPVAFADRAIYGKPTVLVGISNPFVWLLTIPSMIYVLYKGIDGRSFNHYFLFGLFLIGYLPFLIANRPIWAFTAFSILPYAFMAVAYAVCNATKNMGHRKTILSVYIFLVCIAGIPLYLLAVGKGFDNSYLRPVADIYRPSNEVLERYRSGSEAYIDKPSYEW